MKLLDFGIAKVVDRRWAGHRLGNNLGTEAPEHRGKGGQGQPESKTSQQDSQSGPVCKTSIPGSNPGGASKIPASNSIELCSRQRRRTPRAIWTDRGLQIVDGRRARIPQITVCEAASPFASWKGRRFPGPPPARTGRHSQPSASTSLRPTAVTESTLHAPTARYGAQGARWPSRRLARRHAFADRRTAGNDSRRRLDALSRRWSTTCTPGAD